MALKYSRQRETIKEFLLSREDHPTADIVYLNVRRSYPRISLGTVYRNLNLLAAIGDISRICIGDSVDRYEANTAAHCHFICQTCGQIFDLNTGMNETVLGTVNAGAKDAGAKDAGAKDVGAKDVGNKDEYIIGTIDHWVALFYGQCRNCIKK
ncbi:MAG: transcriptional repressor [Lachnospiraceae bacterium]|nr:transcriptional repressor [Lachnospiraceae bacterium]